MKQDKLDLIWPESDCAIVRNPLTRTIRRTRVGVGLVSLAGLKHA